MPHLIKRSVVHGEAGATNSAHQTDLQAVRENSGGASSPTTSPLFTSTQLAMRRPGFLALHGKCSPATDEPG